MGRKSCWSGREQDLACCMFPAAVAVVEARKADAFRRLGRWSGGAAACERALRLRRFEFGAAPLALYLYGCTTHYFGP